MSDLYARRGVSAQKEDVHAAIKNLDKGLYNNVFCKILPDHLSGSPDHCCIMHADTAGTKSILAYLYWKETGDLSVWKGIAQDAMVMNIDDMICSGATNDFLLSSTIARNKHRIPAEVLSAVINGCAELITEWGRHGIRIHSAGGETADVGDLVQTIDVGYTAMARLPRQNVVHVAPQPGDVIVGFASYGQSTYESEYNSGIGCNGLTSARHDILNKSYLAYRESYDTSLPEDILYVGNYKLTDTAPNGMPVGKLLLSPTRTFAPVVRDILENHFSAIRGIIHNTGGGQTKCLKYIPDGLHLIKDNLFAPPFIFQWIQEAVGTAPHEMYQVFNMGNRLDVFTDADTAQQLIKLAEAYHIEARVIGRVQAGTGRSLLVQSALGEFEYKA